MRHFFASLAVMLLLVSGAQAIPTEITYQGTIKEKGFPVTGTRTMMFRITDETGRRVYWSGGGQEVPVTNGLFSVRFAPSGVEWEKIVPYIEVSVNGQQMSPRDPITLNIYSAISADIVDGVVTSKKLSAEVQQSLVPKGAIMLFESACPEGWSHYAPLNGRFPMGSTVFGATGGAREHSHPISVDGSHNHGGKTGPVSQIRRDGRAGGSDPESEPSHNHAIDNDGAHNHGGATASSSSLPPYLEIIFCKKS